ncbi:hypothetical protein IF2G_07430 [Cordyceps javanica]|nr:hypothetical protein IF2G_07430 [Cordyceps javanica]
MIHHGAPAKEHIHASISIHAGTHTQTSSSLKDLDIRFPTTGQGRPLGLQKLRSPSYIATSHRRVRLVLTGKAPPA